MAILSNVVLVGWHCFQYGSVALSTAEAEYMAASIRAIELLGIRNLFIVRKQDVLMLIICMIDNQVSHQYFKNEASTALARHVDV